MACNVSNARRLRIAGAADSASVSWKEAKFFAPEISMGLKIRFKPTLFKKETSTEAT